MKLNKIITSLKKKFHANRVMILNSDTGELYTKRVKKNQFGYYIKNFGNKILFLQKDGRIARWYEDDKKDGYYPWSTWKPISMDSEFKNWLLGKNKSCNCRVCEFSKDIEIVQKTGSPDQLRELIDKLHDLIGMAEEDRDYWKLKAQGKWPK